MPRKPAKARHTMLQSVLDFFSSIAFAIAATFGFNMGIEQPRYDVIERIGSAIEIRHYPKRIAAETTVEANESSSPRSEAFRALAGYIFGANKGRQKIEMTAPVEISSSGTKIAMTAPIEVNSSDTRLVMRFFMPAEYSREQLPEPSDPRVKLIEMPPTTVAVLRFSGSTGDAVASIYTAELLKALQSTKWKVTGPATAFFYNPSWTLPFLRTNEVAIPVSR
jgi:effector-binding domain-containing protein